VAVGSGWPDSPVRGLHGPPTIPHRRRHPHPAAADIFPPNTTVSMANATPFPSRRRRLLCTRHTPEHGQRDPSSIPPTTFSTPIAHPFPPTRHHSSLSHKTLCHPSPQKQIGTPAQLREPTRTPLLYSRPVTRSPRKTSDGAKRGKGGENADIFLWGSRATGAPPCPQSDRASGPKWPGISRGSLPMIRAGDP